MKPIVDFRTLGALVFECALITATIGYCITNLSFVTGFIGFIVLSTRQHALLMLYHDAVHGLIAKKLQLNDIIINLLVGIPVLLPVEVFRELHLKHHRQLGNDNDPERTILFHDQYWQYRALPLTQLLKQVAADLLPINAVKTIVAWNRESQKIKLNRMTWLAIGIWIVGLAAAMSVSIVMTLQVIAFWLIPLFTLTNLLQKIRSFAEHGGATDYTGQNHEWTYSWKVGWLGRLTIWPYNINRHREHHSKPNLPWHQLPKQIVNATDEIDSRDLIWHLLKKN